jgi:hypothetical protein
MDVVYTLQVAENNDWYRILYILAGFGYNQI